MKRIISNNKKSNSQWLLLFLILNSINVFSQKNLVPNYSFEQYITCPSVNSDFLPSPWYVPTSVNYQEGVYANGCDTGCFSVPHNCIGTKSYQPARTGNAYALLNCFSSQVVVLDKTYLQLKIQDSLIKNKTYYAEFFVSLTNVAKYGCNNIGILFTDSAKYQDTLQDPRIYIPAIPQILNYGNPIISDTLGWVKISGVVKAKGGERYLTIGNFNDNNHTQVKLVNNTNTTYKGANYYVDDVSVIPLDSMPLQADAGKDTTIHIGDSVFIGSYTNGLDSVKWFNGLMVIDSTRPGFWVHPLINTCYVLTQTVNGYTSSDTVYVNVQPLPLKFISLTLNPSPKGEGLETLIAWQTANEINVSHYNIQRSTNGKEFINISNVKAQNKSSNEYSFTDNGLQTTVDRGLSTIYYRIESIDNDGKKQYSTTKQITTKPQTPNSVSVFPNPAKDVVTISSKENIKEVKMVNQLGQVVQQLISNNQSAIINVQGLAKGLYLLQITTSKNKVHNEKIVVK